jgi:hypothetical protein
MNKLKSAAAVCLAASVVVAYACTGGGMARAQTEAHHARRRSPAPAKPSVEEQIEQLREQMQSQIDELKQELAGRDAQLQQAQQSAAAAQAAADKAQAAATEQQQAVSENTSAVGTLQSSVNDLKSSSSSLQSSFTSVQKDTAEIKKAVEKPDELHFKGITISPTGSFLAAETVWRQGATGGDINTQFTGVPLNNSDAAQLSEFQGSGRQSRIALKAVGDAGPFKMTGYYEMDWLGAGISSNNNQSNSYVTRQRQLWADAAMKNGWDFSGGQGWSMVTETTNLLARGSEILPGTIDPQYEAGFMWTRQYSFRVVKNFDQKFAFGLAAENAETLNPSGQNLPTNLLIGSAGNGGGLYNSTANYSFNKTPDFVAKIAAEPGWGHWELIGIGRSFRDRIYPTGATPYNDSVWGGGIGGGFRGPLANKKISIGLKGLWGQGVGRYGSSTIGDITLRPDGTISPLHGFSALSTLEFFPTPRWYLYVNYGGDYIGRDWTVDPVSGKEVGYGTYTAPMWGCSVEPTAGSGTTNGANGFAPSNPANCSGSNKDVQEFTAGYWYNFYKGPKGNLRYGLQYSRFERNLWSGNGANASGVVTNPGGGAMGVDNMFWTSFRYYLP